MFGVLSEFNKLFIGGFKCTRLQTRNTFILKRRNSVPLSKKGLPETRKLRRNHFAYDLVKFVGDSHQPNLKIILNQYVEGVGNPGDLVELRPSVAYRDYLLTGIAVYATPENLLKIKAEENKPKDENLFSSRFAEKTIRLLSTYKLSIVMNKLNPWVLEPWHVSISFRKAGLIVPEHAIEMPPGEIRGPDLSLEDKEFYITVTVNKKEKVNVRCSIHHWATGPERLPKKRFHWAIPREPLFPEQASVLAQIPLPPKRPKSPK